MSKRLHGSVASLVLYLSLLLVYIPSSIYMGINSRSICLYANTIKNDVVHWHHKHIQSRRTLYCKYSMRGMYKVDRTPTTSIYRNLRSKCDSGVLATLFNFSGHRHITLEWVVWRHPVPHRQTALTKTFLLSMCGTPCVTHISCTKKNQQIITTTLFPRPSPWYCWEQL